jgi:hypothetical protein
MTEVILARWISEDWMGVDAVSGADVPAEAGGEVSDLVARWISEYGIFSSSGGMGFDAVSGAEQAPDPWEGFPDRIRDAIVTALAAAREGSRREMIEECARIADAAASPIVAREIRRLNER